VNRETHKRLEAALKRVDTELRTAGITIRWEFVTEPPDQRVTLRVWEDENPSSEGSYVEPQAE